MIRKFGNRAFHGYLASKVLAGVKFTVVTGHCTGLAWRFRSRTLRIESLARVFLFMISMALVANALSSGLRDKNRRRERTADAPTHLSFSYLAWYTCHGVLLRFTNRRRSLRSKHAWRTRSQSRKLLFFAPMVHLRVEKPCLIQILEFGVIRLGRHSSTAQSWCQIGNGPPVNEPSRCEGCFKKFKTLYV